LEDNESNEHNLFFCELELTRESIEIRGKLILSPNSWL